MKNSKRFFALLLALLMTASMVPAAVLADEPAEETAPAEEIVETVAEPVSEPAEEPAPEQEETPAEEPAPAEEAPAEEAAPVEEEAAPAEDAIDEIDEPLNANIIINFNANGGTVSTTYKTITAGSAIGDMPVPTATGYTFKGWWTSPTGGEIIYTTHVFSAGTTLYAHWEGKEYTVTFRNNASDASEPYNAKGEYMYYKAVHMASAYGDLATVTRSGYKFLGWYTESVGGYEVTSTTLVKIAGDHALYAHWGYPDHTVSFDANGGIASFSSKTVNKDSAYGELPTATREGFTFQGWYTAKNGGTKVTKDTAVSVNVDHTLYAIWLGKEVKVTFDANGGTCGTASKTANYCTAYGTLPTPTRTGYTFGGWYLDKSFGESDKVTAISIVTTTSDHTLYAKWTAAQYTVTLNGNGGTASPATIKVTYGGTYTGLPTPTYSGYTFQGWFTAAEGGNFVNASSKIITAGDHTLYAQWIKTDSKNITITFNANGGSVDRPSKIVTTGGAYSVLPIPTRAGYTFDGWYTAASGGTKVNSGTTVTASSNHTLYAHWEGMGVACSLDTNGGYCNTGWIAVTVGKAYSILPEAPAIHRDNYDFTGWYTAAEGGTLVTNTTIVAATGDHKLYAHWTNAQYTLTFDANGGSCGTASKTVAYTETYGTLPVPTKTGADFVGWFTEANGGTQIRETDLVSITKNTTVYAHWTASKVTVSLNANGGAVSPLEHVTYYSHTYGVKTALPTPTRTGYKFLGWFTAMSGGEQVKNDTVVTNPANHTIYAQWEQIELTITFDANGGEVTPNELSGVHYGDTYGTLPTPTKTEAPNVFGGWYLADGVTKVTGTDTIKSEVNFTLKAKWYDAIQITVQPMDMSVPIGGELSFTCVATGYDIQYQWQYCKPGETAFHSLNKSTNPTAVESTYVLTADTAHDGWKYRCKVTDGSGKYLRSVVATFTLGLEITQQPVDCSTYNGGTAKFTVKATGNGLTYQWQERKDAATEWADSTRTGAATDTLTFTAAAADDGYQFRCVIKDANGHEANSEIVNFNVVTVIVTQPKDASGVYGTAKSFSIVAMGSGLKYCWEYSTDNGASWEKAEKYTGYTTTKLTVVLKAATDGWLFRCGVTDDSGAVTYSNTAKLYSVANIVTQPKNAEGFINKTAEFKVVTTGTGLSYRWQYSKDGGTTWTSISSYEGAYTDTLTFPVVSSRNGWLFRCVIKDCNGKKTYSDPAKLTVAIELLTEPESYIGATGSAATFTVEATGYKLKYQWQLYDGSTWVPANKSEMMGYTTASFSIINNSTNQGYKYRCVITDGNGKTKTSKTVTLATTFEIKTQPKAVETTVGTSVTFSCSAIGTGVTYRWQYSKDGGTTWVSYSVSNNPSAGTKSMTMTAKASSDGWLIRCMVKNSAGAKLYTDAVSLTVN